MSERREAWLHLSEKIPHILLQTEMSKQKVSELRKVRPHLTSKKEVSEQQKAGLHLSENISQILLQTETSKKELSELHLSEKILQILLQDATSKTEVSELRKVRPHLTSKEEVSELRKARLRTATSKTEMSERPYSTSKKEVSELRNVRLHLNENLSIFQPLRSIPGATTLLYYSLEEKRGGQNPHLSTGQKK